MDIRALGYIGLNVSEPAAWRAYAGALGTMAGPPSTEGGFFVKIDERPYRVAVQPSTGVEGLAFAGWELRDAAGFDQACAELVAAGYVVEPSTAEQRAVRQVRGLIRTVDPGGFSVELFWGPVHDHELFVSPEGVSDSSPATWDSATSSSGRRTIERPSISIRPWSVSA